MFLLLSSMLTGVALCALLLALTRPVVTVGFGTALHGNRMLLRITWPWICAIKPICEPFVSWHVRAKLTRRTQLAGLSDMWQPSHVVASQVLIFLACITTVTACLALMADVQWTTAVAWGAAVASMLAWLPVQSIKTLGRQRQERMLRELPFLLDMTTLCVEAGLSLHGALQQAARHGPEGPLRAELHHALADMRAGTPRVDALNAMANRTDLSAMRSLVSALVQADHMGASLGPLLRSQSDQRRAERFLRAEELALKAPVKMLFPMVVCIFPCTFLIIGFPIVSTLLDAAH